MKFSKFLILSAPNSGKAPSSGKNPASQIFHYSERCLYLKKNSPWPWHCPKRQNAKIATRSLASILTIDQENSKSFLLFCGLQGSLCKFSYTSIFLFWRCGIITIIDRNCTVYSNGSWKHKYRHSLSIRQFAEWKLKSMSFMPDCYDH